MFVFIDKGLNDILYRICRQVYGLSTCAFRICCVESLVLVIKLNAKDRVSTSGIPMLLSVPCN